MSIFNREELNKVLKNKATVYAVRAVAVVSIGYLVYKNPKAALAILGYCSYELYISQKEQQAA